MALTPKQQRFVQEYLLDLNATQAALRAGYSPHTAKQTGTENLAKPAVAASIQAAMAIRARRVTITQDEVVEELKVLSTSDIRHYTIDDAGNLTLAEGAPDYAMRAVSGLEKRITWDKDGNKTYHVKFRLWDKPGTLRLTSQHLGMLVERVEHGGPDGGPLQIEVVHYALPPPRRAAPVAPEPVADPVPLSPAVVPAPTVYGQRNGH